MRGAVQHDTSAAASPPQLPRARTLTMRTSFLLYLFTFTVFSGVFARGSDMCLLFAARNFSVFHFGRVDFSSGRVVDVMSLPPSLSGAEGGVSAGADDGQFFIPNANVAYNALLEVNIVSRTTATRLVAPPPAYAGTVPAFYTMQLDPTTDDIWAIFESSTVSWVATATVFPGNGSSAATSANFVSQWIGDFLWRKAGVAALDTTRRVLYFVAGVPKGGAAVETLVGVPVGDPSAPVKFVELPGPVGASADIDFLAYSSGHDLFIASCFSIVTGVASIKTMPGNGTGGWTTVFTWPQGAVSDMELGNGALTKDGDTFYVALTNGTTGQPALFAFEVPTGKLLASFTVPTEQYYEMLTAEVVAC